KLERYAPVVSGELSEMHRLFVDKSTPAFQQLSLLYHVELIES
ncbi:TPA: DeoR/GlpR transcriptional regulator, partial [Vibrio cholerae]|nr:DeoR/GlpR transcriptional regulator [Vibrio cholerae]